jgi:hypothetical protein
LRAICVVPPECRLRKQHPKESPQVARIQTATQQLLQNFTDSITPHNAIPTNGIIATHWLRRSLGIDRSALLAG